MNTRHPLGSFAATIALSSVVIAQAAWTSGPAATFLTGQVAYGPAQQVWFAGLDAPGVFVVARWNGQAWTASPAAAPPGREGHAMAFDLLRNRLVLFGGRNLARTAVLGDLWEFDGTAWAQRTAAGTWPSPRFLHAMTWDAGRNRIAMGFGSANANVWGLAQRDLWEWDGMVWSVRIGFGYERIGAALAHDPVRNELVLVGGHAVVANPGPTPWAFTETYALGPSALAWTHRTSSSPAVSAAGFAFDPIRGRLVLAGGTNMGGGGPDPLIGGSFFSTDATAEWNGTIWSAGPPLPSIRSTTGQAFDAVRNQLVVVGGNFGIDLADVTALRSATAWTQAGPGVPPGLPAMAHDPLRGRVVGIEASFGTARTWEWNGSRWLLAAGFAATPPARTPALAWDPVLQQLVLMTGGSTTQVYGDDLWSWNGAIWTLQQPAVRPPQRRSTALATDLQRSVVVLYGGWVPGAFGGSVTIGDTWEWNGVTWTQIATSNSPGPRADARMAFDRRRGRIVLHGGTNPTPLLSDTWEYDGMQWLQRAPTTTTMALSFLAWDDARQRLVLSGLSPSGPATYEFDGTSWTTLASASPSNAQAIAIGGAYDSGAERIVAYADRASWLYATPFPASAAAYGAGCASSAGILGLGATARPWLGDSAAGELAPVSAGAVSFLALGWSNSVWGTTALPASLAGLGAPGCEVVADPLALLFLPTGSAAAPWSLALPNLAAFAGLDLFAQGGVLDPAANLLGLATSNGLALRLGIR